MTCPGCGHPFTPRKVGKYMQKTCSLSCKRIRERMARAMGEAALNAQVASRATGERQESE